MKTNRKDSLGDRMKMYEGVAKTTLMKRVPVIIRIDGKAFHTFTKGFVRPFDDVLIKSMQETTLWLCENIQGCVLGYTESDEITLVLCDYQTYDTSAWFDYEVQKLCSIAASMATMQFNRRFYWNIENFISPVKTLLDCDMSLDENDEAKWKQYEVYRKAYNRGAMFDARCFNVPKEEVHNVILWRQQDATRNSIQMVGQTNFSQKQLEGKSCNEIQDMLHEQKGINWNNFETYKKRGAAIIKKYNDKEGHDVWIVDTNMPILTEDRNYVSSRVEFEPKAQMLTPDQMIEVGKNMDEYIGAMYKSKKDSPDFLDGWTACHEYFIKNNKDACQNMVDVPKETITYTMNLY